MGIIRTVHFKSGPAGRDSALSFAPGSLTLLIGPNNSGKSLALREINDFCTDEEQTPDALQVIDRLEFQLVEGDPVGEDLLGKIVEDIGPILGPSRDLSILDELMESIPQIHQQALSDIVPKLFENAEQKEKAVDYLNLFIALVRLAVEGKIDVQKTLERFYPEWLSGSSEERQQLLNSPDPLLEKAKTAFDTVRTLAKEQGVHSVTRQMVAWELIDLGAYRTRLKERVVLLNAIDRYLLSLPAEEPPDLRQKGPNKLTNLLQSKSELEWLRKLVFDAFGYHLTVDITHPPKTYLRLSKEYPGHFEYSIAPDALAYFDNATELSEFSDGVRSYTGMLVGLANNEFRINLLDEPEAFLHPPLIRKLGRQVHELARKKSGHVFAATHSADFVAGCLQAGQDVNIVRLTYRDGNPTARLLSATDVQRFMLDPLLRSTGVLSALFHLGVVVGEADADRSFYQEINERLVARGEGFDGCLFLNAQNKQTLQRIIGPLRRMGIPAAAIVDLDIIKDPNVLKELLSACGLSEEAVQSLTNAKSQVLKMFTNLAEAKAKAEATSKDVSDVLKKQQDILIKKSGIAALSKAQGKEAEQIFLRPLKEFGIFVVPVGELEQWLSKFSKKVDKQDWLWSTFQQMGADPTDPTYLHPSEGDVWDFMRSIAAWLKDPERSGMPA